MNITPKLLPTLLQPHNRSVFGMRYAFFIFLFFFAGVQLINSAVHNNAFPRTRAIHLTIITSRAESH